MTRLYTASLAFAGLACAALSGCLADNDDGGLFFSRVLAPTSDCTFTAMDTEAYLPRGSYGLLSFEPYTANAQVVSRITAAVGSEIQRTVQLRGARIDIAFADGKTHGVDDQYLHFKSLTSGPVAPNGGITDNAFPLVPFELANAVALEHPTSPVEIRASVEIYGEMGGDEVKTQKFVYPIDLRADIGPQIVGECPLPMGTVVHSQNSGCSLQQDSSFVDCCTDGSTLVCPAEVTPTPPMN
ncbi:MAG TPA: hypothetical protein VGM39_03890 [Kofleriaceae bacterium]|jgi:hypothetical protein